MARRAIGQLHVVGVEPDSDTVGDQGALELARRSVLETMVLTEPDSDHVEERLELRIRRESSVRAMVLGLRPTSGQNMETSSCV